VGTEKRERQKAGRQTRREAEQKAAKRRKGVRRSISTGIAVVVVVGLSLLVTKPWSKSTSTTTTTKPTTSTTSVSSAQLTADTVSKAAGCPLDPATKLANPQFTAPPMTIDTSKTYTATIKTDLGAISVNLNVKSAAVAVNSFVFLANKKYYDCNTFARVIPQFVNQTGDPTGTTSGSAGYTVQGEVPATATPQYPLGSLAMAKTSAAPSGTTSNQFFIVAGTQGESLPPQYALFGQVTSGQDIVQKINTDGSQSGIPPTIIHRMLSVTVTSS